MFHCNGWTYTWAVTLQGGTHVCLRRVDPARIFALIAEHGVTHLCAAPVVLTMLIHAPDDQKRASPHRVGIATGGAAPPSTVIAAMERARLRRHAPVRPDGMLRPVAALRLAAGTARTWPCPTRPPSWRARACRCRRWKTPTVIDTETGARVPADGATLGEIALRGNTVMKGYLRNPRANAAAFVDGWFRTGDLGVLHPDGYIEVKDRAKDIVISGGENISSAWRSRKRSTATPT